MNLGLSDKLKIAFPNTIPVIRPLVNLNEIRNPHWLAGFVDGEGCFSNLVIKKPGLDEIKTIVLEFKVTQHTRDNKLLESLVKYLDCGNIYYLKGINALDFKVRAFKDIDEKIIPFFIYYPLHGVKLLNYFDFVKAAEIIQTKGHLTEKGLSDILLFKGKMNSLRSY